MKHLFNYCLSAIAALLPAYMLRFRVAGIPTNALELGIIVLFGVGLLAPAVRNQWVRAGKSLPRWVVIAVLLFIIAAGISTYLSPHHETSLGILKGWIGVPILYAALVYAAQRESNIAPHITNALIVSGVAMALLGMSQFGVFDRIQGIYDVPNSLAIFLAPLIVLATVQYYQQQRRWYGLAAAVMLIALLGTQSVGGVLATLATAGLYLVWNRKRAVIFIWIVVGAILISIPKIQYLLQPTSSAAVRLQLWDVSAELIREHPVAGIGLGTFEPAYQQKIHNRFAANSAAPLPEFVFRDPHNWVLSFWLNVGLLGLVSFAGIHGLIFAHTRKLHAVHYALLTLLLFGLVDTIYWKNDLAALHWILLALSLQVAPRTDRLLVPAPD